MGWGYFIYCMTAFYILKDTLHFLGLVFPKFPSGSVVQNSPVSAGDVALILGQEDPQDKETATHSWTEELAGYSPGCHKGVKRDLEAKP